MPQSDSRLSSRQQSTWGSELCSLGQPRDHRGSHFAMDNVLRNDKLCGFPRLERCSALGYLLP